MAYSEIYEKNRQDKPGSFGQALTTIGTATILGACVPLLIGIFIGIPLSLFFGIDIEPVLTPMCKFTTAVGFIGGMMLARQVYVEENKKHTHT